MRALLFLALLAIAASGCSDSPTTTTERSLGTTSPVTISPATTSPVTTSPATTGPSSAGPVIPAQILEGGFGFETITIGDRELDLVAIADAPSERSQGLMFVTEMGDVPGMLFVYSEMRRGTFWMKNTLIPLDIAFFDMSGRLVDKLVMEPCPELGDDCPTYAPEGPFQYAYEAPLGALSWLSAEDRLLPP